MTAGSMSFVLHTHLPYCREAGRWPHGEEWFHEAMLECYLPLIRAFRRLASEIHGSLGVTINITPILAEQIADALMQAHFREYLAGRIDRAEADTKRFAAGSGQRAVTAAFHLGRYRATQAFYEEQIGGDPLRALRELESAGAIEIATSAATHGYLPLLDDDAAVRFQVHTGVRSHVRNFGRRPRSFWLPECAYEPGLERFLAAENLKVFFVETHLVTGGQARGKALGGMLGPYPEMRQRVPSPAAVAASHGTTFRAYSVGRSPVEVIARNERTGLQVWSASHGYPGEGNYREFHKKDEVSGLHYWRVTSPEVDLGEKEEYDPAAAAASVRAHAEHFRGVARSELDAYTAGAGEPGLVLAAYDTELFGHWWLEGVDWLEETIRGLAGDPDILLTTAGDYVSAVPPKETIALPEGSWGNGGDHRTWLNAETAWTWPEIHRRQHRAAALLRDDTPASRQLARELLLLQSSDWQFLMTTGQAHDYAMERFGGHASRFDAIAAAMEGGDPGLDALVQQLGALDNPFPLIDPTAYLAAAGAPAR
ncbi:MAG: 1,4-alpha-glucan branching protein domain-containing protein [Tepidiformaceae bacterium]